MYVWFSQKAKNLRAHTLHFLPETEKSSATINTEEMLRHSDNVLAAL